jgi:hypothetical protein
VKGAGFGGESVPSHTEIPKELTGRQAMIARAIMPNKIRILFVVIFMSHLHIVLLMDGALRAKVPG